MSLPCHRKKKLQGFGIAISDTKRSIIIKFWCAIYRRGRKGGLASRENSGQDVFVEASTLALGAAALNVSG